MAVFPTRIMYLVISSCATRFRIPATFALVLCTVSVLLPYRDSGLRIQVKTVVPPKGFREEPNDSQYDHRVDLLGRYIAHSYVQVMNFSKYSVWETAGSAGGTGAASGMSR